MSALLRAGGAPIQAGGFSLAAGVAVADAIAGITGLYPRLKWPNDVLLGGRKVAGILIESAGTALIVGIGVNVAISLGDLPLEAAARATSLDVEAARAFDPGEVLPVILDRLSSWYGAWRDGEQIVQAWRARDATLGAPLRVTVAGQTLEGLGDGVDDDGALRLRLDAGGTRRVLAGEVEVIVRP
jgi:BirA family biotin operon repressor/biotin-[acetyl-CoA-carboxylase] ligase